MTQTRRLTNKTSLKAMAAEIECDRLRMNFILTHPDEAASAVADAYSRWDGEGEEWGDLLRWEIDYQIGRAKL